MNVLNYCEWTNGMSMSKISCVIFAVGRATSHYTLLSIGSEPEILLVSNIFFHTFFIVEWQYCYCNKCLIKFWITWERNDDVLHTTAQILSISQIWLHPVPKLSSLQRVGINPCLVIHLSLVHQVPKISPATWCLKEVHLKLLHNQINYSIGCHCRSCPLTTPTHIEVGDNTTIW